jgi:hypothetical protein
MYAMSSGHQIVGDVEFKIEMSVSGLAINALGCRSKAEIRHPSGAQPGPAYLITHHVIYSTLGIFRGNHEFFWEASIWLGSRAALAQALLTLTSPTAQPAQALITLAHALRRAT